MLLVAVLPVHAAEIPKAAEDILQRSGVEESEGFAWSFDALVNSALGLVEDEFAEPLAFAAELMVYLAVACLVGLLADGSWKRCLDAVAVLGFGALCLSDMMSLMERVAATAADSQAYLVNFIPVFSGVLALGGQTAGAAMYVGMFFAMSTFLSTAIEQFLLPVMQIYFCFAISAALWGNPGIEEAAHLFSRCMGWILKGCGALFTFVLGLQGILAGNSDSAGVRVGKSLLSGVVPVVGDAAAAALESSVSAVRLLKGSLALAVICVMAAAFLPVLLRCGLCFLTFSSVGILASATGQRQSGQICRLFADGAGLCASVLILYFFMVFLSTMLLMITGSGG